VTPWGFNGLALDTNPDVRVSLLPFEMLVGFKTQFADVEIAGRLRPGISHIHSEAECRSIWQRAMKDYYANVEGDPPDVVSALINRNVQLDSLERGTSIVRDSYGGVIKLLMAAVLLVFLSVVTNAASFTAARLLARQHELAVRVALCCTSFKLLRELIHEPLVLTGIGTIGGFLVTIITTPLLLHLLPPVRDVFTAPVPVSIPFQLNARVLLFIGFLWACVVTICFFALIPNSRLTLVAALKTTRATSRAIGRKVIVVLQIAVCTCLLVTSLLLVRSLFQLRATPSGIIPESVVTFSGRLPSAKAKSRLVRILTSKITELPFVKAAGTSSLGILRGHGMFANVAPAGLRVHKSDFMAVASNNVSPGYLKAVGMSFLAGRDLSYEDVQATQVKVVVNEAFTRRFSSGLTTALGKHFGLAVEGSVAKSEYEIVGVVNDAKYRSLRDPIRPAFYVPQSSFEVFVLNVKVTIPPQAAIQPILTLARSVDPEFSFLKGNMLSSEIEENTAPERTVAILSIVLGLLSTLLAAVGIYTLLAYTVLHMQRELAVRMALGAGPIQITQLILNEAMGVTFIGISLGTALSFAAAAILRAILYGVNAFDSFSFLLGNGIAIVVAILIAIPSILTALDAAPADALRTD